MSLDMDDVDKTYKNIAALRDMKIAMLPPDVNQSRVKFTVADDAIRFGLAAIRGVGSKPGEAIIAEREAKRRRSRVMADFCMRVGTQLDQPARARRADQVRRVRFTERSARDADG